MKPRKRRFIKRDNRLRLAYQEMGVYEDGEYTPKELVGKTYGDIIGIIPTDEEGRWDIYLLFNMFVSRPIADSKWDNKLKKMIEYPSLIKELENRGYDPRTIYFEIEKRNPKKEYRPIADKFGIGGLRNPINDSKLRDYKRLKALDIIKKKDIDLIKLKYHASYEEYEIAYILDHPRGNHITKQEFDLLKEVGL